MIFGGGIYKPYKAWANKIWNYRFQFVDVGIVYFCYKELLLIVL